MSSADASNLFQSKLLSFREELHPLFTKSLFIVSGGVHHQESEADKLTNPEMRKARFDLLYKEYEVITFCPSKVLKDVLK